MAVEVERSSHLPPKTAFYNDPRIRGVIYQIIVLSLVIAAGAYLVHNTIVNRERLGVATGFGFLNATAGFDVAQSLISYTELSTYGRAFIVGLLNTFY
ncbi:MAG: amino acid ABC transporter permease, partial [Pseudomonadota bacterium]